jgi:hypothetical protein
VAVNLRWNAHQGAGVNRGAFLLNFWVERVGLDAVGPGGKHEVGLAQATDAVRPHSDLDFSPGEANFRMMVNGFRQLSNPVGEVKRLLKIIEPILFL